MPFKCGILGLVLLLSNLAIASVPTHRYSFDGNANDGVGVADGTLVGSAVITNGTLVLNGTNGCVELPGDLFTNSTSLTLETWFVNTKTAASRVWYFPGSPSIGYALLLLGQSSGCYYGTNGVAGAPLALGEMYHLVWTQDHLSQTARIYLDGQLVAEDTNFTATPGTTANGYLGASSPSFPISGRIPEFRIYSNALSQLEVLQSDALGPDQVPTDGETLTSLHLRGASPLALGSFTRPFVAADFTHQTNVNLTPLVDVVLSSSDTNILRVTTDGRLQAINTGVIDLSASYGGLSDTNVVEVVPADELLLAHRYEFEGEPGKTNIVDSMGGADGTLYGRGYYTNGGQLYLSGGINGGYVDLPDGLLSGLNEVTIEAWVTQWSQSLNNSWARVFDFGSNSGAEGISYFFLTPWIYADHSTSKANVALFAVSTNSLLEESPRLFGDPSIPARFEAYFAVTYSPSRDLSKFYTNGILADSGPAPTPLNHIVDTNNWLGRSQFQSDPYFYGFFNEFRIYRTVLDHSEIAASYAMGPEVIGADFVLHARTANTNLILSWGPSAAWCMLQASPSLAPGAVWTNAPIAPVFTNGQLEVALPLADTVRFFRLGSP